jgi:methylenetetrahydrofolate reductase (NADH)
MSKISTLLEGGRSYSFEFFPPKTVHAQMTLGHTIASLEPLDPTFVSVTYGAGGTTRERTHEVVTWVQKHTHITGMAHLTCVGNTRGEIERILNNYTDAGIENIMALAGDAPKDGSPVDGDFRYATDLVAFIKECGDFAIGVAAHPEGHPLSQDLVADRERLAHKLSLADFAVTQFFFDAEHYFQMVDGVQAHGVHKPIIPGIMPVTNVKQIQRMAEMSGAEFPDWLAERLRGADSPEEVRKIGIEVASELCQTLLNGGAPGLHYYTMNRSTATREIHRSLRR